MDNTAAINGSSLNPPTGRRATNPGVQWNTPSARRRSTMSTTPTQPPPRVPTEPVEQRLRRLEAQWLADTQFLSDARRIIDHPAFRQIVALGREAVPTLLRDLQAQPSLWVWALSEMTGEDPVTPADAGNVRKMSDAWVAWGKARGLLT
jgi:hypothetical protein